MNRRTVALSLLAPCLLAATIIGVTAGGARSGGESMTPAAQAQSADVKPVDCRTTTPERADDAALAHRVAAAVTDVVPGTRVGLAVHDRLTGTTVTSMNADEQFYTASVVKLLIAIAVLREANWQVPEGQDRTDLAAMLSGSSDPVASALWGAHGTTDINHDVSALLGLRDTSPPSHAGQWEMTRMSPRDVIRVYEFIDAEMPGPARDFIVTALAEATRVAVDGFDQYFGIPDALPGAEKAVKQGWMHISDGLVLNTTGLVGAEGRYVVVLLTEGPSASTFDPAATALTRGVAVLAPTLTGHEG
ncbi:serine hydrolase [Saccharomonospora sp. NPDC006951]